MGLFGDDEKQDERLDALEHHIRTLTEAVHKNQMDTVACMAGQLRLQAQLDEKISASDVDPVLSDLNKDLREARKLVDESARAASGSWATLQEGVGSALETLRKSVTEATERLTTKS